MARLFSIVALCISAALCQSCATSPLALGKAAAVGEVDPRFAQARAHSGTIQVDRASSLACRDAFVRVLVDGEHAANVGPGATVRMFAEPGVHVVSIVTDAHCAGEPTQLYISVADGETRRLVASVDLLGHLAIAEPPQDH